MKKSFTKKISLCTATITGAAILIFFIIMYIVMWGSLSYHEITPAIPALQSTTDSFMESNDAYDIFTLNQKILIRLLTIGGGSLVVLIPISAAISIIVVKKQSYPFMQQIDAILLHSDVEEYTELSDIKRHYEYACQVEKNLIAEKKQYTDYSAHELRNFLTLLTSKIDVFGNEDPTSALKMLQKDIRDFRLTIDDLMAYANLSTDSKKLDRIDLLLCAATAADEYGSIGCLVDLQYNEVNDYQVMSRQAWIERLIANLLHNAVTYGTSGLPVLLILEKDDTTSDVSLTVENHGLPISPDDIQNLFKPYFKKNSTGKGLGLAFVKEVVKRSHGEIFVDSNEERTRFTVTFYAEDGVI